MWVKLTRFVDREPVYVNLSRFDLVFRTVDDENNELTRISSTLSAEDDDVAVIDVVEPPEAFMGPPKMKVSDNGQ